jgi:hypothetical protein
VVSLIKVEMKIKVSDLLSLCFVFVFVKLYVSLTMKSGEFLSVMFILKKE